MSYVPPQMRQQQQQPVEQAAPQVAAPQSSTYFPPSAQQPILVAMPLFQQQEIKIEKKEATTQELAEEYLDNLSKFQLPTTHKPLVVSEATQKALKSRKVSKKERILSNVELGDAAKQNLLQLHNVALEIQDDIQQDKPIHVILQNYISYTSKTHLPMYINVYRQDVIDTSIQFIDMLFEARELNIIYNVLDTIKGAYFKFFPFIQEEILYNILEKALNLIQSLKDFQSTVSSSLIYYKEKLYNNDSLLQFIFSLVFKIMQFASTCFYPNLFCDACSKLMMISVKFNRLRELDQIIQLGESFLWADNLYDDYSSAFVQKLVYLLRADMISAMLSVKNYEQCYVLILSTSQLVQLDIKQQFVDIEDIHVEVLRLLKLSIKFFNITQQPLSQAQCLETFIRLSIAFNIDVDKLSSYANEAIILLNSMPHISNENFNPSFILTANPNFYLNTSIKVMSYQFIADVLIPTLDVFNLYDARNGPRGKINASIHSYVTINDKLDQFLKTYCAFPKYLLDPEIYLTNAKKELDSFANETYSLDIIQYADRLVEQFFNNAIILFIISKIQAKNSVIFISEIEKFLQQQVNRLYKDESGEINIPLTPVKIIKHILPLITLPFFQKANTQISLTRREIKFQNMKLLPTLEECEDAKQRFLKPSSFKPQQSKFTTTGILCDSLQKIVSVASTKHISKQEFAEIIVENKKRIQENERRKREEYENKQEEALKLTQQRDKELKKLAEHKQEDEKMKTVFTQIINKHILSRTEDDEELKDFLKSVNLQLFKPIQWQGELMKKEAEFNQKRLQDRQNNLNKQTQKVEAQIYYIRQLQIEERKQNHKKQVAGLNEMLAEMIPIRFQQETEAFEHCTVLKEQLQQIGDYETMLTETKAKFQGYFEEQQREYDEKLEELTQKLTAEHEAEEVRIQSERDAEEQKKQEELLKLKQKSEQEQKKAKMEQQNTYQPKTSTYVPGHGNYKPGNTQPQQSSGQYRPAASSQPPSKSGSYVPPHLRK